MKRFICVLGVVSLLFAATIAMGEEIRSGLYEFDLSTGGSMSARNGTSTFLVDGSSYIDMSAVKPNLGVFSIQMYQITKGALCGSYSDWMSSGATYTVRYYTSNSFGTWSTGTTTIAGPNAISGSSTEVRPFTPEFAKYYKFEVVAGITQFGTVKGKLLVQ